MDLTYAENPVRGDDWDSRLVSLRAALPESTRLIHELRKLKLRRQETHTLREDWLQRHRPYSHHPSTTRNQFPRDIHLENQFPFPQEQDFHLATLPAALSSRDDLYNSSACPTYRRSAARPVPVGEERRRIRLERIEAGLNTPQFRTALTNRLAEREESPNFDALNRPFVPLPHLLDQRPASALYCRRKDIDIWKAEVEKRVPVRRPLAVSTKLSPPKHVDLSEGEFLSVQKPVFYHTHRSAPPRQYVINREWFSEKSSLKNLKGHRSNRLVFGWTK